MCAPPRPAELDGLIPARVFDNFQFVCLMDIMRQCRAPSDVAKTEALFALNALMEVGDQSQRICGTHPHASWLHLSLQCLFALDALIEVRKAIWKTRFIVGRPLTLEGHVIMGDSKPCALFPSPACNVQHPSPPSPPASLMLGVISA